MEKELIIKRLRDTVEKLKSLPPQKFRYDNFVSEYDTETVCGTVCCVAGWYPVWFPEAGLKYYLKKYSEGVSIDVAARYGKWVSAVNIDLINYHGIAHELILVLFYGESTVDKQGRVIGAELSIVSSLEIVIKLWEVVIDLISEEKIDYQSYEI